MIEDLRTAGEAFEDEGYEVISYTISPYTTGRVNGSAEDPEEALDEYLRGLNEKDRFLEAGIYPETVLDLFLRGSGEDVEQAINGVLQQVHPRIRLRDPEEEEMIEEKDDRVEPVVPYILIRYNPQVDEGVFSFDPGRPGTEPYINEFTEILQEEGLRVDEN